MDWLLLWKALILGIVEGLTEFLPISSTGHLIIAGDLLDYTGDTAKVFEIVIQLGAILAVCWEYRERLMHVLRNLRRDPTEQRFVANLMIAFMPAAVIGLALHHAITTYLFNPITVACALIGGGLVILLVERRERTPRITDVDQMDWRDALKVGFAQAFALFPGTSRSGATIIGGLIFGLSRKAATEFSFFLAVPTMFAATFYDLLKNRELLQIHDLPVFGVGFVAAFISAFFAVKGLLRFVAHHNFNSFAWYRVVFGIIVLLYFMNGG